MFRNDLLSLRFVVKVISDKKKLEFSRRGAFAYLAPFCQPKSEKGRRRTHIKHSGQKEYEEMYFGIFLSKYALVVCKHK